jgi:hypothetical protein
MSSLIAAYVFNEGAAHDYSGNKYHLTNGGTTFPADTSPFVQGYDASITSGANMYTTSFASLAFTSISIHSYVSWTSGHGWIMNNAAHSVQIDSSGNIVFVVTKSGGGTYTATSATALTATTWYDICCVWDQHKQYIYINGVLNYSIDAVFTTLAAGDNTFYVGAPGTMVAMFKCIEVRNIALTIANCVDLTASPGGVMYSVDAHNFAIGDLIADSSVVNRAVVTWPIDANNFLAYPLTSIVINGIAKYGNIYNTARQYIMEINSDFDGNGNSQLSIKYPIASFIDYAAPPVIETLDYRGWYGTVGAAGVNKQIQYNASGVLTGSLIESDGVNLIVPGGSNINGGTSKPYIDLNGGYMYDSSSSLSIDFGSRILYVSTQIALRWDSRTLVDSSGQTAMSWQGRHLLDAGGNLTVDFNARSLSGGIWSGTTPSAGDNTTNLATTAFVVSAIASGSVTSVGLTDGSSTPIYNISGSPVTSSGYLTFTLKNQNTNYIFAGPSSGPGAGSPTFRAMVSADIPSNVALAGSPTTTTQTPLDNSTKVATTAYVDAAVSASKPIGGILYLFYNF